jgi:aspartate-semialdehyde dehydrogenase
MNRIAIVHPTTLLGKELREGLERRRERWTELLLLSTRDEEVGTLVDVAGGAAMVKRAEPEDLRGLDLVFFCDSFAFNRALLEKLPEGTTAIVLSADAERGVGTTAVAGLGGARFERGTVLISPHPVAVALAHLLYPLLSLGLRECVATVLQPASMLDDKGLEEVLEQTRSILNFTPQESTEVFGRQLAFNMLPTSLPTGPLTEHLLAVLDRQVEVSLQLVQAGVFHGLSLSLFCRCGEETEPEAVRQALEDHPILELMEEPELLGPIDAAARDEVLVGTIRPDPVRRGGYWIWAVMDNLTRGGAVNALQIAQLIDG